MTSTAEGSERSTAGQEPGADAGRFASLDPRTGAVVGYHPVQDEAAVRESVDRARQAAAGGGSRLVAAGCWPGGPGWPAGSTTWPR